MNLTLDTFRNHFWNIATVIAVVITVLIVISFIAQVRESSGITFGKLPTTEIVGAPFTKDFTFEFGDISELSRTKVALLNIEEGSVKKAKFLAKVLKINGKSRESKDTSGNTFVEIKDKNGLLTYYLNGEGWNYVGSFKVGGGKRIDKEQDAKEIAVSFLKRLNLDKELTHYRTTLFEAHGVEFDETSNEEETDEFLLEFTGQFEEREIFDTEGNPPAAVQISKEGFVAKVLYNPLGISTENVGTYPIINIAGVEKRLSQGQGTITSPAGLTSSELTKTRIISFNKIDLVYVADKDINILVPFWILSGIVEVFGYNQEIVVVVNAIVDKYLKD